MRTEYQHGPGSLSTTIALLVIAPLLYCASEWAGLVSASSEPRVWPSRVTGRVIDEDRNVPVAGANVIVWAPDPKAGYPSYTRVASVESGTDGGFAIDYGHPEGVVCRLTAQADAHDTSSVAHFTAGGRDCVIVTIANDARRELARAHAPRSTNMTRIIAGISGVRVGRVR
jgi:hypothetical protein